MTQEFKRPSDEAYAQWIRRVVRRSRQDGRSFISLFDSSVPEPVELLRETIAEGFSRPLTSRYTSAFSGGNPYVLDLLAARHGVSREQVICTTGATGALALLYRAFTRPG
ncbi:MAG TPA: pyridoxal phosphate-dependent aminotransferase, partial [Pedomonas sp.]|nr:pyridoxal phosphate-dependent aminotransferase [Pedomonas sp.]